jgi:hypothetical protein
MLNVIMLNVIMLNVVAALNTLDGGGSTVVEHSTHNPKTEGSSPANGTGREKMTETGLV